MPIILGLGGINSPPYDSRNCGWGFRLEPRIWGALQRQSMEVLQRSPAFVGCSEKSELVPVRAFLHRFTF